MADVTSTLLKHRTRLNEIAGALARHGLAAWAARGGGIAGLAPIENLVQRVVSEEDVSASEGERLRGALAVLGTTAIKFGQMLSLRPDVVGQDIADELALLQAEVPADAPGVAARTVETQLGKPMSELYGSFDPEPFASGSVAQVHRTTLSNGTVVAVKVLHDGADAKVRKDLELLEALAAFLESEDTEIARLRPTILVAEFAGMMEAAIDLRQELASLQRFRLAESFFASLKLEHIDRRSWATRAEVRAAVFDYIERFYNRRRLHSSLDYLTPVEYETRIHHHKAADAA